jgi:hypothetical protein
MGLEHVSKYDQHFFPVMLGKLKVLPASGGAGPLCQDLAYESPPPPPLPSSFGQLLWLDDLYWGNRDPESKARRSCSFAAIF